MKRIYFAFLLVFSIYSMEASARKNHHLGIGPVGYLFQEDLKEQFNNTIGFSASYEYTLPFLSKYEPGLGLRFEYFNPKKNDYDNLNLLFTPYLALLIYDDILPLGLRMGFDVNYWKQSKTFIRKEVYHEDVLYGFAIGLFSRTDLGAWGHIGYSMTYHLQQFDYRASFLALGLDYVFDF